MSWQPSLISSGNLFTHTRINDTLPRFSTVLCNRLRLVKAELDDSDQLLWCLHSISGLPASRLGGYQLDVEQ